MGGLYVLNSTGDYRSTSPPRTLTAMHTPVRVVKQGARSPAVPSSSRPQKAARHGQVQITSTITTRKVRRNFAGLPLSKSVTPVQGPLCKGTVIKCHYKTRKGDLLSKSAQSKYACVLKVGNGEIRVRFDGCTTAEVKQHIPVGWVTLQLKIPVPGARVQCRYEKKGNRVSNNAAAALVLEHPDADGFCRVIFTDCGVTQRVPCEWIHDFQSGQ